MATGIPTTSNPLSRALGGPDIDHNGILQHLGAAVLMRWNNLPRDVQRGLFEDAVGMEEQVADDNVRQHMAVFLHQHKDDVRAVDTGGGD